MRGRLSRPEAMSMAAEQCAIIWATSIFPHCRCAAWLKLVEPRDYLIDRIRLE
jgi:hypothetical protein